MDTKLPRTELEPSPDLQDSGSAEGLVPIEEDVVEVIGRADLRVVSRQATPASPDPILTSRQQQVAIALVALLIIGLLVDALTTAVIINVALTTFFVLANVFKLSLVRRSLNDPCAITVPPEDLAAYPDEALPVYTVLVPVYREAAVLQQLMEGIAALDYPHHKLDVKVLLEEDDPETAHALAGINLPSYVEVLIVPDVGPQGKPRACNHGLDRARGKYLVIYDAEDRPEHDQLRKVARAFDMVGPDVVCIHAKLNYFNRTQNLLTRWFTAEYSAWFDQLLPGLQSHGHAIPLGGTSNHLVTSRLRQLGGWNAYNVTEDADLGLRIFRTGGRTAVVDSTTFEEANSRPRNWIRQRSRSAKGYMQTYLSQMREPVRVVREMGWGPFVSFQLFFGAQTLGLLLNPVYWTLTTLWFVTHSHIIEVAFPPLLLDVGVIGLFIGNIAFAMTLAAGCLQRRHYGDVKWSLLVPAYWVLMSMGAWKGFFQLFVKPYYWEKTTHGYFLLHPTWTAEGDVSALRASESTGDTGGRQGG